MKIESARQFLKKQFESERFPKKASKEFVTLGFMSAYTGLIVSEEQLEFEKERLKKVLPIDHIEELLEQNRKQMDDEVVQALSDDVQLLLRRRVYQNNTSPIHGAYASLYYGVELYRLINQAILN